MTISLCKIQTPEAGGKMKQAVIPDVSSFEFTPKEIIIRHTNGEMESCPLDEWLFLTMQVEAI
jgi:hypothetical protein